MAKFQVSGKFTEEYF